MLKKKLLISLVVIQGLLIIFGIIAIIFGVFYKMSSNNNSTLINKNIDLNDVYLINENQYQQKFIFEDKIIFQIVDINSNKVLKEKKKKKN